MHGGSYKTRYCSNKKLKMCSSDQEPCWKHHGRYFLFVDIMSVVLTGKSRRCAWQVKIILFHNGCTMLSTPDLRERGNGWVWGRSINMLDNILLQQVLPAHTPEGCGLVWVCLVRQDFHWDAENDHRLFAAECGRQLGSPSPATGETRSAPRARCCFICCVVGAAHFTGISTKQAIFKAQSNTVSFFIQGGKQPPGFYREGRGGPCIMGNLSHVSWETSFASVCGQLFAPQSDVRSEMHACLRTGNDQIELEWGLPPNCNVTWYTSVSIPAGNILPVCFHVAVWLNTQRPGGWHAAQPATSVSGHLSIGWGKHFSSPQVAIGLPWMELTSEPFITALTCWPLVERTLLCAVILEGISELILFSYSWVLTRHVCSVQRLRSDQIRWRVCFCFFLAFMCSSRSPLLILLVRTKCFFYYSGGTCYLVMGKFFYVSLTCGPSSMSSVLCSSGLFAIYNAAISYLRSIMTVQVSLVWSSLFSGCTSLLTDRNIRFCPNLLNSALF